MSAIARRSTLPAVDYEEREAIRLLTSGNYGDDAHDGEGELEATLRPSAAPRVRHDGLRSHAPADDELELCEDDLLEADVEALEDGDAHAQRPSSAAVGWRVL